ncbi:MAG: sulfotransferase, partial [Gammaproteobacteria bacterium]
MPLTVAALNRSGNALRRLGIDRPRLDRDSLIDAAIGRAGSESFGSWPFEEPLDRLLLAYEGEAALSTVGRLSVRELLVSLLANLIDLESERKEKPAITAQTIDAPVFITGLPRTGTTLLHGLIAQDPGVRVPMTWEVMYPAGFEYTAPEIASARRRTNARLTWANRLAPEFRRIHEIDADLPQECIAIMAQGLFSIQFHTTHNVPSYEDWFEQHGQQHAYEFHHRVLQHLQAKSPAGRWVLKAPGHLFGL